MGSFAGSARAGPDASATRSTLPTSKAVVLDVIEFPPIAELLPAIAFNRPEVASRQPPCQRQHDRHRHSMIPRTRIERKRQYDPELAVLEIDPHFRTSPTAGPGGRRFGAFDYPWPASAPSTADQLGLAFVPSLGFVERRRAAVRRYTRDDVY